MKHLFIFRFLTFVVFTSCLTTSSAFAKDHILTIGGGYSPSGNQVSLEKNVLFFRKLLSEQVPDPAGHDIYFADGNSNNPDVQFEPANDEVPKANRLMARIFGREKHLSLKYRNNELGKVNGISNPDNVAKWFTETGSKMTAGDRLILYVTAHGGKCRQKGNTHNTRIHQWKGKDLEASKLAEHINSLPKDVSVVTVMVQCYSGGFSHLIFNENNKEKGDNDRSICGFFAAPFDRVAAGCTPDINEEDYDEYSSHFWAALRGKSRMEKSVGSADYDGDGDVSFEEAHTYAILTSKNLDVPVKTSDAFLRAHSKLKNKDNPDLYSRDTPYFQLISHARPIELAMLDGLTKQLDLKGNDRAKAASDAAAKIEKERKELGDKGKETKRQYDSLRNAIQSELRGRWPELTNTLSPVATRLLTTDADTFIKAVESHPKYNEMAKLAKERNEIENKRFELEKRWARHQRFLRVLDNVAFATNLPKVADKAAQERYARLLSAESSSLKKPLKAQPAAAAQKEQTPKTAAVVTE